MRNCRAGITGGGGQNRHRFVAGDMGQHLRHKAAAEIFKRQRRAVEQLQAANIILHLADRSREGESGGDALFEDLLRDLVANKGRQNSGATGGQIHLQHVVNFSQAKFRQVVRKEQPLLLAKPLRHGLRKADLFVMIF